ncbi:hypothetical protein BV25DRAFT_1922716 [Artomyces pyxidatus]|uniref:Uncharacterized protein n=1 Tax=Artomyces pyxidatus TaxID=48021 RepID=A0ACB8SDZ6_9AGAM|nr:hypothetical protein BV25DRAFT_1922716 [Artomyces pyxidatus]
MKQTNRLKPSRSMNHPYRPTVPVERDSILILRQIFPVHGSAVPPPYLPQEASSRVIDPTPIFRQSFPFLICSANPSDTPLQDDSGADQVQSLSVEADGQLCQFGSLGESGQVAEESSSVAGLGRHQTASGGMIDLEAARRARQADHSRKSGAASSLSSPPPTSTPSPTVHPAQHHPIPQPLEAEDIDQANSPDDPASLQRVTAEQPTFTSSPNPISCPGPLLTGSTDISPSIDEGPKTSTPPSNPDPPSGLDLSSDPESSPSLDTPLSFGPSDQGRAHVTSAPIEHEHKIRGKEERLRWYETSGGHKILRPPTELEPVEVGDIFIHKVTNNHTTMLQKWMWDKSRHWVPIEVGRRHPLPSVSHLRFWLHRDGTPGWITKKTAATYQGRERKSE